MKKLLIIQSLFFYICLLSNAQWVMTDSVENSIVNFNSCGGYLYGCSATAGVYISADSGLSFVQSNEGLGNLNTRMILPRDSMLVLGTNNSIYKSIDYGATWVLASNGFPITTLESNVTGLIFRGDSILVATYGSGIYCSVDNCETWFPLNNGFTDLHRCGLIINGKRIFTGTMYGGTGIYASDDGGESWVQKNNGVPTDPYNPDKYVDINCFTSIGTSLFAATRGRNILKSENNGDSWTVLDCPNNYVNEIINVDNTLICGHDGVGVTQSEDLGDTWVFRNEGLEPPLDRIIHSLYRLGPYIYVGTHYNRIFRRPVSEIITGLPDQKEVIKALIYPNPLTYQSKIIIPFSFRDKLTIEIYNEVGQLIKRESGLSLEEYELNRTDFCRGIYFLRVMGSNNKLIRGKFIVN